MQTVGYIINTFEILGLAHEIAHSIANKIANSPVQMH